MKVVLVTGGAGFIGSHFVTYLLNEGGYEVVNLDALTYAGDLNRLKGIDKESPYTFVKGSILDYDLLENLFKTYDFEYVINFAAESHVDRSIESATSFVLTNVMGTQSLMDVCKAFWRGGNSKRFIQISTDEVYGSLEAQSARFTEDAPLRPSNPYAASKASADLLVASYIKTYGFPAMITRCTNNFGENQNEEKLIPKMIERAKKGEDLPLYGDGLQERTWLHVNDHCDAIHKVMENGNIGEVYNISGDVSYSNKAVCEMMINHCQSSSKIVYTKDRLAHDRKYGIDDSKIRQSLKWCPKTSFKDGLKALF